MPDRRSASQPEGGSRRKRRFTVDSLFQDTSPRAAGVRDLIDAKEIAIDRIVADPNQPRQSFDDERLDELAASIRNEGILQPVAVRYDAPNDVYVIVHGERRWRAARIVGLDTVPAIVRDVPEERRLIQQLMENVVREDLNAVDRAAALRGLKRQMNDAPWERVAEAVGIKRSRLFQLLSTEKLADSVQDAIRSGQLSEKQSRALQGLSEPAQAALSRLIVDESVSEAVARRLARAMRDDPAQHDLDEAEITERLIRMRESLQARPTRTASRRDDLSSALRQLLDDPDVPDEPVAAVEHLARAEDRDGEDPQAPGAWAHRIALQLARQVVDPDAGGLSRSQLLALRRVVELAIERRTD